MRVRISHRLEPPQLPSYAASPTTNDAPRAGAGSCKRLDSDRFDTAIGAVGRAHVATWADTATVLAAQCARPAPRPLCRRDDGVRDRPPRGPLRSPGLLVAIQLVG